MTTQLLLRLAQQGDAIAIAALMNSVLKYQHIRVSAQLEQGCLRVMFKSTRPLNQHATIAFVRRGLWQLQAESIQSVRAYAWHLGQEFPAWVAEFAIVTEFKQPEAIVWEPPENVASPPDLTSLGKVLNSELSHLSDSESAPDSESTPDSETLAPDRSPLMELPEPPPIAERVMPMPVSLRPVSRRPNLQKLGFAIVLLVMVYVVSAGW